MSAYFFKKPKGTDRIWTKMQCHDNSLYKTRMLSATVSYYADAFWQQT